MEDNKQVRDSEFPCVCKSVTQWPVCVDGELETAPSIVRSFKVELTD